MEDDSKTVVRTHCSLCTTDRIPPIRHMTVLVPLIMLLTTTVNAMCPTRCECNDEKLYASCAMANLQVVPIQLNPELKHINLSFNKINNIHFTLEIYANLINLDISHNKIHKLGSMNFVSQRYLTDLNIGYNQIEILDKDVFKGLKSLKLLDLSTNQIEEINSNAFFDLHSLEKLYLNNNKLISFDSHLFVHQKQLKVLKLDDNQLLEIPFENLAHTNNLEVLSMSRNLVESIEEESFPLLSKLQVLHLDSNVISSIHTQAFDGITFLENLNLSDNNFTHIPTKQLSKLSNLLELDLSKNFFNQIPPVAFRGLFKLKVLSLNAIETLEKIDFRAFVDNINLQSVYINDNIALSNLPTRLFHGNPKIKHISIKNNILTTLEVTHFPLDNLETLQIAQNPLECNCSLIWLWLLIKDQKYQLTNTNNSNLSTSSQDLLIDVDGIKCAGPEKLTGVLLENIPESEIQCSTNWIAVATGSAMAIFIITTFILGLYYARVFKKQNVPTAYAEPNNDRQRAGGKCDVIGPPLLSEYESLPSWENMYQNRKDDMYRQFGYHINVVGQNSRPHIVYV